jgi:hypothetical protein
MNFKAEKFKDATRLLGETFRRYDGGSLNLRFIETSENP